jgi:DNA-directed RNA polymerase subunit F
MWAKGERQNVTEAKEFLESKHSEGILTEEQLRKLCDVINKYTVRR